jgi:hypothetical protein
MVPVAAQNYHMYTARKRAVFPYKLRTECDVVLENVKYEPLATFHKQNAGDRVNRT